MSRFHQRLRPGAVVAATARGYRATLREPGAALDSLLSANPSLDRGEQRAELRVLLPAFAPPGHWRRGVLAGWARWDLRHGILEGSRIAPRRLASRAFPTS